MSTSVVIPTHERPDLVVRAVRSALAQTYAVDEVVVVIDGESPDPATERRLRELDDPRVVTLPTGTALGNAGTRNLGIHRAQGEWIALLDDDDTWARTKLAAQHAALDARASAVGTGEARADGNAGTTPVASCHLHAVSGERRFLWPRLRPAPGEPVSEYLFCRRRPMTGDRLLQTSTLLAPRELFLAVPFRTGRRFVDQDWLLRAAAERSLDLVFPDTRVPLVEWDIAPRRARVSDYRNWRWCIDWARERAGLLGPRAHAAFLLTLASSSAAGSGEREAFVPLLREAFAAGRPNAAELASHCANFAVPRGLGDRIVAVLERRRGRRE